MGKVKGSIFVKVIKTIKKADAVDQVPAELRPYFDSHQSVSQWFEEAHYLTLMKIIARVIPNPGMDVWEYVGRDSARVDYEGMYKSFLENRDPASALSGFRALWPLRHDTGTVKLEKHGANADGTLRAAIELSGYALVSPEIYRSIQGTIWQTLHMAGARSIEIDRTRCPTRGHESARWELRWRE